MKKMNPYRDKLFLYLFGLHLFVLSYLGFSLMFSIQISTYNKQYIEPTQRSIITRNSSFVNVQNADQAKEIFQFYFNKNFTYSRYPLDMKVRLPQRFLKFWPRNNINPLPALDYHSKEMCKKDTDFIVVVNSAVEHFDRRNAIRRTWANQRQLKKLRTEVVFLLGRHHSNNSIDQSVNREAINHGDIVVGNYIDDYRNLTLKTLLGLKWIADRCSSASFMIHADDDVYLDLQGLNQDFWLQVKHAVPTMHAMHCGLQILRNAKITRRGKWASTIAQYDGLYYPPYCNGPCYAMSVHSAIVMHEVSRYTPNDISVDDVLVTGILREKVGLSFSMLKRNRCKLFHKTSNVSQEIINTWKLRNNN